MRLTILILSLCYSALSFGQDSLIVDTVSKGVSSTIIDELGTDSNKSVVKNVTTKKKKKRKIIQDNKIKEEKLFSKEESKYLPESDGNRNGLLLIVILVIGILIFIAYKRSSIRDNPGNLTDSSKDDDFLSDYLSRKLLSRREYYRNVYLKSDAWKRKRYVVLKRDNWRCVYCGGRATQVHHTRYAKRNIGKEPIEWLVSICKTCHESKH